MDVEETQTIEKLLGAESSAEGQKAALKRLSEMLEETYILNLPPSKKILSALNRYAKKTGTPASLAKRAAKVHNQYKL